MKILALETSTEIASIALNLDGQLHERQLSSPPAHSATLLPELRAILSGHGLALRDLDGIACGVGPGAFTGVRLACSVAQGLALGGGLRVWPVCSLLALAEATGAQQVYCAMDARMGEAYIAAYRRDAAAGWVEVIAPCCVAPDAAPLPPDGVWQGAGNAFAAYPALSAHLGARVQPGAMQLPGAAAIARLAMREAPVDPALIAPLYVRDRVAQTVAERLASGGRA